jgi:macrolide-specific efflux system membrane fusion protein
VLTNLDTMLVQATFDQTDASTVKVGAAATITPQGVTNASEMSATVEVVDPTSTTSNGVVDYGVTLALTTKPAGLKPGESVSVSVITGKANNALYVPSTAVTTSGNTSTVTVVGADNKTQTVQVTLGLQGSTATEILAGLTTGQKVLTTSATASTGSTSGGFRPGGGLGGGVGGGGPGGG